MLLNTRAYRLWNLLGLFVIFVLSVMSSGYEPVGGNNVLQIPMVSRLLDPHAYPHDPLVDAMNYYSSPHWHLVALVSRWVPLETLLLLLFLLSRWLMVSGAYVLACTMAPSAAPWVGYLAASVFILQPNPLVGEGTVAYPHYEHSSLAQAVLLWSTTALIKRQKIGWAVLLGIVFNLTVLYGVAAIVYYSVTLFWLGGEYRKDWKAYAKSLAVLGLVASPALWMLWKNIGQEAYPLAEWVAVQRARSWFHLFPLAFPVSGWLKLGLLVVIVLLLSFWARQQSLLTRWIAAWTFVMAIWVVLAFIAVYLVPNRLLIAFQPIRATDLWYPVAIIGTMCMASTLIGRSPLYILLGALAIGAIFAIWRFEWHRQAVLLSLSAPMMALFAWRWRKGLLPAIFLAYLFASVLIAVSAVRVRGSLLMEHGPREGDKTLIWASQHLPRNTLLLVPPHWHYARVETKRSVYVTWKDGTATLFCPPYTAQWVARMRTLGWDPVASGREGLKHPHSSMRRYSEASFWTAVWRRLDDLTVKQLHRDYGITHWVLEAGHPTTYPEIFRADGWKIVWVASATSTTPTSQPRRESQR